MSSKPARKFTEVEVADIVRSGEYHKGEETRTYCSVRLRADDTMYLAVAFGEDADKLIGNVGKKVTIQLVQKPNSDEYMVEYVGLPRGHKPVPASNLMSWSDFRALKWKEGKVPCLETDLEGKEVMRFRPVYQTVKVGTKRFLKMDVLQELYGTPFLRKTFAKIRLDEVPKFVDYLLEQKGIEIDGRERKTAREVHLGASNNKPANAGIREAVSGIAETNLGIHSSIS